MFRGCETHASNVGIQKRFALSPQLFLKATAMISGVFKEVQLSKYFCCILQFSPKRDSYALPSTFQSITHVTIQHLQLSIYFFLYPPIVPPTRNNCALPSTFQLIIHITILHLQLSTYIHSVVSSICPLKEITMCYSSHFRLHERPLHAPS